MVSYRRICLLSTSRLKIVSLALLLLLLLILPGSGICIDVNGTFMSLGLGPDSCGKFMEAKRSNNNAAVAYLAWVSGYLTGANVIAPNTYNILGTTDMDGAMLWIENYCQQIGITSECED